MAQAGREVRGGQTFNTTADDGNFLTGGRGFVRLDAFGQSPFPVHNKAFQIVDAHGIILEQTTTVELTGGRTDPRNHRGERHSFFDHLQGGPIFPFLDQPDIFLDVQSGGTGPLAGSHTVFHGVFPHDSAADGGETDDVFGTDFFTGTATGTLFLVHLGQPVFSDAQCPEGTGGHTGSQPQTSDPADFHAAQQHGRRPAVLHTFIYIVQIGIIGAVETAGTGKFGFFVRHGHAHDGRNGVGNIITCSHAGIDFLFSVYNGFGTGRTTGKSATAAVCTRQYVVNGNDLWIFIHIKRL